MAQSTHGNHDNHSTSEQGTWTTKRIAITALFCSVAAICTLMVEFPILPGVTWLKYDPSGIVALVAGFAFGPATGAIVSTIPYLVHLATQSGIYGMLMAMLATIALVLPASLVYPALLPFNLLKIGINCAMCVLVYKPIVRALDN